MLLLKKQKIKDILGDISKIEFCNTCTHYARSICNDCSYIKKNFFYSFDDDFIETLAQKILDTLHKEI